LGRGKGELFHCCPPGWRAPDAVNEMQPQNLQPTEFFSKLLMGWALKNSVETSERSFYKSVPLKMRFCMYSAIGTIRRRIISKATLLTELTGVSQSWLKPPQQDRRNPTLPCPERGQNCFPGQGCHLVCFLPTYTASRLL